VLPVRSGLLLADPDRGLPFPARRPAARHAISCTSRRTSTRNFFSAAFAVAINWAHAPSTVFALFCGNNSDILWQGFAMYGFGNTQNTLSNADANPHEVACLFLMIPTSGEILGPDFDDLRSRCYIKEQEHLVERAGAEDVGAPLPAFREISPQAKPPVLLTSVSGPDSLEPLKPAERPVEAPDECLVIEICVDDYLWSLYERTPKVDMNKVVERIKVTVRKRGA